MHPQDTIPDASPEAEEWRPVVGYEGWYSVSNLGRVRRDHPGCGTWPGRILKPQPNTDGRRYVILSRNNQLHAFNIHPLVMLAFVGVIPEGHEVNHIDGDCTNNRLSNLEYVTPTANRIHAQVNGLIAHGERHGLARLTDADVRVILTSPLTGREMAIQYGVSAAAISSIRRRKTWKHVDGAPVLHIGKGERSAQHRLTNDAVRAIRASTEPQRVLAQRYGVGRSLISKVQLGNRWKHLL